ncbi:DUF1150 family protein [Zavarzinia compransoris]|uniref:DUF1150 domain-containing protein n=1 Tax=Zavarzinia compransoris TaxID=1264899 RepID=A0A317E4U2_9PROT|nr:DUF1150 family protein [Zavarzinia compransoris]PWR22148.1 hypothetical protein DKG75_09260 [Zavarzinia compransoris]TDP47101.1 hypothetical protein DES42_103271 [Zavarzinia compransoris]
MIGGTKDTDIRLITPEVLANLGGGVLVYVKPVTVEGKDVVAVHGADGALLALLETRDLAFAAALQYEMQPLSVH